MMNKKIDWNDIGESGLQSTWYFKPVLLNG